MIIFTGLLRASDTTSVRTQTCIAIIALLEELSGFIDFSMVHAILEKRKVDYQSHNAYEKEKIRSWARAKD
jgi:hypothetical protein